MYPFFYLFHPYFRIFVFLFQFIIIKYFHLLQLFNSICIFLLNQVHFILNYTLFIDRKIQLNFFLISLTIFFIYFCNFGILILICWGRLQFQESFINDWSDSKLNKWLKWLQVNYFKWVIIKIYFKLIIWRIFTYVNELTYFIYTVFITFIRILMTDFTDWLICLIY
jgi:hypothetical protein